MLRLLCALAALLLGLTACVPAARKPVAATQASIAIAGTVSFSTASFATAEPVQVTPLPPDFTPPPTPVPPTQTPFHTLPGKISPTELKYRVLEMFPDFFFCDPDFYPIARGDEQSAALAAFPVLQANPEEFNAILAHTGLTGVTHFSDEQKLIIYRQHKKLAALHFDLVDGKYRFQILQAKTEGQGESISGTIDSLGEITVIEKKPAIATCPICLAPGTRIAAPGGPIRVEDLRVGMLVWTVDSAGVRIQQPVVRVIQAAVPPWHEMVRVVLEDGREVQASPPHPTVDGRIIGQLKPGDVIDGSRIVSIEHVLDKGETTYDLLPAGDTGFYWANGILLASTLKGGK